MYQRIYDYANRHRMKQDLFVGNANWKKGSKAFVRPIKERKPSDSKAYAVPPMTVQQTIPAFTAMPV